MKIFYSTSFDFDKLPLPSRYQRHHNVTYRYRILSKVTHGSGKAFSIIFSTYISKHETFRFITYLEVFVGLKKSGNRRLGLHTFFPIFPKKNYPKNFSRSRSKVIKILFS